MSEPIGAHPVDKLIAQPATHLATPAGPAAEAQPADFKNALLESLEEVNRLQLQANDGVQRLMLGETDNVAEVFSAVQKADVAFSMLMEMRNKLVEAYREIQQMRV